MWGLCISSTAPCLMLRWRHHPLISCPLPTLLIPQAHYEVPGVDAEGKAVTRTYDFVPEEVRRLACLCLQLLACSD